MCPQTLTCVFPIQAVQDQAQRFFFTCSAKILSMTSCITWTAKTVTRSADSSICGFTSFSSTTVAMSNLLN